METIINNPLGVWGVIVAAVSILGFTWFFYQSLVDGGPEVEKKEAETSEN